MSFSRITLAVVFFVLVLANPALAQDPPPAPPVPSYFVISPPAQLKPNYIYEVYGETEFIVPHGDGSIQKGKHWSAALTVPGAPDNVEPDDTWVRQIKPAVVNAG